MEKEEEKGKTESVDGIVDDEGLTAKEKWLHGIEKTLFAVTLLTPTFLYGWSGDMWWKTLLLTLLCVIANVYLWCAIATTIFGSLSDAVEELYSEDEDVRYDADIRYVRGYAVPMITFNSFAIMALLLSHLVGCI